MDDKKFKEAIDRWVTRSPPDDDCPVDFKDEIVLKESWVTGKMERKFIGIYKLVEIREVTGDGE